MCCLFPRMKTATITDLSAGRTDLFKFELHKLSLDPGFNTRTDFGDLDTLCDQIIAAGGVLDPLRVRLKDGRVVITDGERRFRAGNMAIARGFKLPPVPCLPDPRYSTEAQRILAIILLNSGKPLRMIEQARVYQRLHVEQKYTVEQIAKESGHSDTHISNCLRLFSLPENLLQAIEEDKISATLVLDLIHKKKGDMEAVEQAVSAALEKAQAAGKAKATPKHLPADPSDEEESTTATEATEDPAQETGTGNHEDAPPPTDPLPGSAPDEQGRTGIDAIKAASSGSPGNDRTGEGGTADTRTAKLNKMLEETPRAECNQDVYDLLEILIDYLNNERPLGDVKKKLLLPTA